MKLGKRRMALAFCCVLMLTGIMCQSTGSGAKVKINKKNLILTVKNTYSLKVTGTKKAVKWSSNKKKVASISKKGVVTARTVGKAKITAKVGKKKYTCNVTVKPATATTVIPPVVAPIITAAPTAMPTAMPTATPDVITGLAKNLEVSIVMAKSNGYALFAVKNNNTMVVPQANVSYLLKNVDGEAMKQGSFTCKFIQPGEIYYEFVISSSSDGLIDPAAMVCSVSTNESLFYNDAKDTVSIQHSKMTNGDISYIFANNSPTQSVTEIIVFFKDEAGKVIDFDWDYVGSVDPGMMSFGTVSAPRNSDYDTIEYASYELWSTSVCRKQ